MTPRSVVALMGIGITIYVVGLLVPAGLAWVVIHFIVKFW